MTLCLYLRTREWLYRPILDLQSCAQTGHWKFAMVAGIEAAKWWRSLADCARWRRSSSTADDADCVSVRQRSLSRAVATSSVDGMPHHFKPASLCPWNVGRDGPAVALQKEVALVYGDPPCDTFTCMENNASQRESVWLLSLCKLGLSHLWLALHGFVVGWLKARKGRSHDSFTEHHFLLCFDARNKLCTHGYMWIIL